MKPITLRARVVFPLALDPIENGAVTVQDQRIVEVAETRNPADCIDLGDVAILPGLVNAHTHLEFSTRREPLGQPGIDFVEWIRAAISERGRRSHNAVKGIVAGSHESLKCGVTTVGEIATAEASAYGKSVPSPRMTAFREVIGFSHARSESALAAAVEQFHGLQELTTDGQPVVPGISPHAPYTVSPKLLDDLVDFAKRRQAPVAMHLAESPTEREFLANGIGPFQELLAERSMWNADVIKPGSRPLDYLRALSEAPSALVVHGNYLDDEELAYLADHRSNMSLVHCPRTNAYFQHHQLSVTQLLKRGIRVALGTDSRASNPDLGLWNEMRYAAKIHQGVQPEAVLRMGTLYAAEALGVDHDVGSLTPGKCADLAIVPLPSNSRASGNDLLAELFGADEQPMQTWLGGEKVFESG